MYLNSAKLESKFLSALINFWETFSCLVTLLGCLWLCALVVSEGDSSPQMSYSGALRIQYLVVAGLPDRPSGYKQEHQAAASQPHSSCPHKAEAT